MSEVYVGPIYDYVFESNHCEGWRKKVCDVFSKDLMDLRNFMNRFNSVAHFYYDAYFPHCVVSDCWRDVLIAAGAISVDEKEQRRLLHEWLDKRI